MKFAQIKNKLAAALLLTATVMGCKPDGNPNNLPSVDASNYVGKIDGFSSSDEVFPQNLIAYWSFDDTKNELKTGTAPGSSAGDSYATDAVRGKSLSLTAGYLYFPTQFQKFKTDSIKSWSISTWIKIRNNGSKRTMLFQLARPGVFTGNINFALNTQSYNAANDSVLRINPTFLTIGGGTQDNLNNVLDKTKLTEWVHIVLTYDYTTGVFNNWMNGVKVGNFPNRGTGNNLFKSYEPNEIIIGSNYNGIPGKSVSSDVTFAPMTGQMDELRIFNRTLPDAFIKALYNLGKANK
jgi:hypothetical protein